MTVADYRNLRADQKNNVIVASEMASDETISNEPWRFYVMAWEQWLSCPANVPLTRTKDDDLTRREGE